MEPIFKLNNKVFNAVAMTQNLTSPVVDISECVGYAVHAIWTGTPTGNVIISGSNDAINFVTVQTQAAGGAAGQVLSNNPTINYRYVQVSYTFTSGTGSLTAYVSGKGT